MKEIEIDSITLTKDEWDLIVDYTNLVNNIPLIKKQISKTPDKSQRSRFTRTLILNEMLCEKARNLIKTVPNLSILTIMKYKHK